MTTKEAIEKIQELSLAAEPIHEIHGLPYTIPVNGAAIRVKRPAIAPVQVNTLGGFVDCLVHQGSAGVAFAHVDSPIRVVAYGTPHADDRDRETPVIARPWEVEQFPFGQWLDQETFVIKAQAAFVDSEERAKVLKVIGTLRSEAAVTYDDDGVTQKVTAAMGVRRVENVDLPNPVRLAPYRTFREIEQPASEYILRVKGGGEGSVPSIGLFEVTSGEWQDEAMQEIANLLGGMLDAANLSTPVIV